MPQNFWNIRIKDPEQFDEFATQDIGMIGGIQRIAGFKDRTGQWSTQAWRIEKQSGETEIIRQGDRLVPIPSNTHYATEVKSLLKRIKGIRYKGESDFESTRINNE
jgi:hypothetical protein